MPINDVPSQFIQPDADEQNAPVFTRTEKLDPNLQFLLLRPPLDATHSLYLHRNVTFVASVRINYINIDKPPLFSDYSLNTAIGNKYTYNNAVKMGKRLADWFQYFGYIRGYGESKDGLYGGAIRCKDFGNSQLSGKSLLSDPLDIINPFHANGIRQNIEVLVDGSITLSNYFDIVMSSLKNELDSRSLCYPQYLINDLSELLIPGAGIGGYMQSALDDSRSSTEELYREWNGSSWTSKTLSDAYTEAGSPSFNHTDNWYESINRDFTIQMQPYIHRMNDHALSAVLYQTAKIYFPKILCGNYSICHPIAATDQHTKYWEQQHNWFRYPYSDFTNKRYLEADFQSPDIYSPNMTNGYTQGYNTSYNTSFPAPTYTDHIFGSTSTNIYRNYCSQMVNACSDNNNCLPVIPWTEAPHEQIRANLYTVYDANEDDMLYIWEQNYYSGTKRWIINNESQNSEDLTTAKTRSDQLLSTINSTRAWVRSLNRGARVVLVSEA